MYGSIVRARPLTALEMADLERKGEPPIVLELSNGKVIVPGKDATGEPALFFYTPERINY